MHVDVVDGVVAICVGCEGFEGDTPSSTGLLAVRVGEGEVEAGADDGDEAFEPAVDGEDLTDAWAGGGEVGEGLEGGEEGEGGERRVDGWGGQKEHRSRSAQSTSVYVHVYVQKPRRDPGLLAWPRRRRRGPTRLTSAVVELAGDDDAGAVACDEGVA